MGKSSITVNLAAISAKQGLRTLVIDLDPQANSSQYLLGEDATYSADKAALEPNIENFFEDILGSTQQKGLIGNAIGSILKAPRGKGLDSYVHRSAFANLDVIPASPSLGALEHRWRASTRFINYVTEFRRSAPAMTVSLLIHRQHLTFLPYQH